MSIERGINFSAGPAMLPLEVLKRIQSELLNFNNTGASILEINHTGDIFQQLIERVEQSFRDLLSIPSNYKVLFLQGGARGQFAAIPLNLKGSKTQADYLDSGYWSQLSIQEASNYIDVNIIADGKKFDYRKLANQEFWKFNDDAAYVHYTPNETISGVEFPFVPETRDVPLVADMSSNLLSRPIDVSKFGLIYACAQKNLGIAGLTIVIVRDDLVHQRVPQCPGVFDYASQIKMQSKFSTPPIFSIYVCSLLLEWVKQQGGVDKMGELNEMKSRMIYSFINRSFYQNKVDVNWRSRMNVTFTLPNQQLEDLFLKKSKEAGLLFLKGHRISGGIRASLYNVISCQQVEKLVQFMREFERVFG